MKTQFMVQNGRIEALNVTRTTNSWLWFQTNGHKDAKLHRKDIALFDTLEDAKYELFKQFKTELEKLQQQESRLRQLYVVESSVSEDYLLKRLEHRLKPIDYEALNKAILSGEAFE